MLLTDLLRFSFHDSHLTQWFFPHGSDPNRRCFDHTDCTPLSIAFQEAPFATIQLLLDHGVSLQHGQVMHYAAMRELDDRQEVLQDLLDRGHSVNDIMYQNCGDEYYFHMYSGIGTPLHYAAAKGLLDSVKFLTQHGASPQFRDPLGLTAANWAKLPFMISFVPCPPAEIQRTTFSSQMHPSAISKLCHWMR